MRKHKSNRTIGVITFLLMGVGLLVIYAIGPQRANFMNSAYGVNYSTSYFFIHQFVSVGLAIVAFTMAFKIPYEKIRKASKWLLFGAIGCCLILAVLALVGSSLASCQLGACRWISLGSLGSFQPAEALKLTLVIYMSNLIARHKKEETLESKDFFIPFGLVSIVALFFVIILQKDMGTGAVIIAIILAILWTSGIKTKYFWAVCGVVLVGGVLAIVTSPHRIERLLTFSGDGDEDSSYHIENAMMAIGTGGLFGVGIGNSVQSTGYLPESINDSVFAIMGETFGFVGLIVILTFFTILLLNILKTSELVEYEESMVVVGVFAWVASHVIVNVAAMTGMIPLTGITLPLLSFGGTSMMFISMGLGLVSQLSCYTRRKEKNESISSRRGVRRAHYSSSRRSA